MRVAGARHPQPRGAGPFFCLCLVCCLLIVVYSQLRSEDDNDAVLRADVDALEVRGGDNGTSNKFVFSLLANSDAEVSLFAAYLRC